MAARKTVRIDVLAESAWRYSGYDAIVCVDVLLSATTLVTAVAQKRWVRVAGDAERAAQITASMERPLLLTDALSGAQPGVRFGGAAWLHRESGRQALVHLSPFANMLEAAAARARVYIASLRNFEATANELALQHRRVVLIGAGENGEVCAADQMATAWLALRLQGRDFDLEGRHTTDEVVRWGPSDVSLIGLSRSAEKLRSRGQEEEVAFVLRHVNDLEAVCVYENGVLEDPVLRRKRREEEMPTPAWGTPGPPIVGR
jgi:phosphosulfolactate phosphohydrolase-like enzyme